MGLGDMMAGVGDSLTRWLGITPDPPTQVKCGCREKWWVYMSMALAADAMVVWLFDGNRGHRKRTSSTDPPHLEKPYSAPQDIAPQGVMSLRRGAPPNDYPPISEVAEDSFLSTASRQTEYNQKMNYQVSSQVPPEKAVKIRDSRRWGYGYRTMFAPGEPGQSGANMELPNDKAVSTFW